MYTLKILSVTIRVLKPNCIKISFLCSNQKIICRKNVLKKYLIIFILFHKLNFSSEAVLSATAFILFFFSTYFWNICNIFVYNIKKKLKSFFIISWFYYYFLCDVILNVGNIFLNDKKLHSISNIKSQVHKYERIKIFAWKHYPKSNFGNWVMIPSNKLKMI